MSKVPQETLNKIVILTTEAMETFAKKARDEAANETDPTKYSTLLRSANKLSNTAAENRSKYPHLFSNTTLEA